MKKTFILILLPTLALLLLAAVLTLFPEDNTDRKPIVIITASGENASAYKSVDDFIANQDTQKDGMPQTISGADTSVAHGKQNSVYAFCGNKNSKIYHKLSCSAAKKAKDTNKVYFKTLEECQNAGYTPCKMCFE